MKIIVAHNFYMEPGGEDQVFRSEIELLREFGHEVIPFEVHNDAVADMSNPGLFTATIWNRKIAGEIQDLVLRHQPKVVHFHNTFPLISPAAYYAAGSGGAAVVQTLHNFRLICPGAMLYRDGHNCQDCLGKSVALAGIRHGCYRGSRAATAVTVLANTVHRAIGTYATEIDAFIALTPFALDKFITGGLPQEKMHVKPNFVNPDPGVRAGGGGYATFVGRLSKEKGLPVLLDAWKTLGAEIPLKIIGDGPLAPLVKDAVANNPRIEWLGRRSMNEIFDIVGGAEVHIFPSQCYETFGRVAIEAFAVGTPVIASGHGAPADVVGADGRLGGLFTPGDAGSLVAKVREMRSTDALRTTMRDAVRREFESHYTGPRNHQQLMQIYKKAMQRRGEAEQVDRPVYREPFRIAARTILDPAT